MKRIYTTLVLLLIWAITKSQVIQNRAGSQVTVLDANLFTGTSFKVPTFNDTTAANAAFTLDSCGKMIYTYKGNALWYRICNPRRWAQISTSAVSIRAVDTIYRTPGKDSIIYTINGVRRAIKDSTGGGITKAVDTIYRTEGVDSIYFKINNVLYSIKDSTGGGLTDTAIDGANSRRWYLFNNYIAPLAGAITLRNGSLPTNDPSIANNVRISRYDETGADMNPWFTALDNYLNTNPGKAYLQLTNSFDNYRFGIYQLGNVTFVSQFGLDYWVLNLTPTSTSAPTYNFLTNQTTTVSWVLFGANGARAAGAIDSIYKVNDSVFAIKESVPVFQYYDSVPSLQKVTDVGNTTTNDIYSKNLNNVIGLKDTNNIAIATLINDAGAGYLQMKNTYDSNLIELSGQYLVFYDNKLGKEDDHALYVNNDTIGSFTNTLPNQSGILALSVNGNFADNKGNITIPIDTTVVPNLQQVFDNSGNFIRGGYYSNQEVHISQLQDDSQDSLRGFHAFGVETSQGSLVGIGDYDFDGSAFGGGFWYGGGAFIRGTGILTNDTTTYKPLGIDNTTGRVVNMNNWSSSGGGGGGGGTVTSVATGYGLSGGTITTSGTLVADTATLSGKYLRIIDTANHWVNDVVSRDDTTLQIIKGTSTSTLKYVKGSGTTLQYIKGNGTYAEFPVVGGSGGGQVYYFNGNTYQIKINGDSLFQMSIAVGGGAGRNFTKGGGTGTIAQFITDSLKPYQTVIPAGIWLINAYLSESGGGSSHATLTAKLKKWNGSTLTLIDSSQVEEITNGNYKDLYTFGISIPSNVTLAVTDRIVVEFAVSSNQSNKSITLYTEDNNISSIASTFTTGISSLNGLTSATQTFAVGTSGTDFGISSSTATHTFNLPTASATNRGALSSADWSTFNGKIGPSDTATMLSPYLRKVDTASLSNRINAKIGGSGTTGSIPKYTSSTTIGNATVDVDYLQQDMSLVAMQAMGSSIKGYNIGAPIPTALATTFTMTSQQLFIAAIYVPKSVTLTGVRWFQVTNGSFTANNYNGVALYTVSGGTLTLVDSSTRDGNCWQQGTGWRNKDFVTPYSASAGIYYVGVLYSSSAQTTAPAIATSGSTSGTFNANATFDFTNSQRAGGTLASQTALPTSQALSGTSTNGNRIGVYLY